MTKMVAQNIFSLLHIDVVDCPKTGLSPVAANQKFLAFNQIKQTIATMKDMF
jgi:hypothetical protein